MNVLFHTGASGLFAFQEELNVIGNNMSNVGTIGYKPVRVKFEDLLYTQMNTNVEGEFLTGHGVKAEARQQLTEQGNPNQTNRQLDFAIMGEGYFAVDRNGQREYTRNGDFGISVESGEGYLVTSSDGAYVLDSTGARIGLTRVEDSQEFDLTDVQERLGVWFFSNPDGLQATNKSSFLQTAVSGEAVSDLNGGYEDVYKILSNTLEQSAVNVADEMSNMITAQRAYQLSARMVQTSDEIEEVLNNLR